MLKFLFRLLVGPTAKSQRESRVRNTARQVHVPRRQARLPAEPSRRPTAQTLRGKCYVIDGDTIVIKGTKIRVAGIDAPELHHPWGKKSKYALVSMCKGQIVTALIKDEVSYDRIVAKCLLADGTDLAAELVKQGLALDWPKFSGGEYAHLEPNGIRKKLWRAAAKQQGRLPPAHF